MSFVMAVSLLTACGSNGRTDSTVTADSAMLVGEENAEATFEKMSSMVTGTVIGEEAVEKYADGNELFRHTYHQNKILRLHISLMIAI